MTTLRSYIDPDRQITTGPTSLITEQNQHEVRCGMCARAVYVDDKTYRFVSDGIKSGLDNPFLCEVCEERYDDLAYEG
jgi:uncharacterized protein YlaI